MASRMKPTINSTRFGSITIEGEIFANDVLIRLGGEVMKRKKKLSKAIYGTSHVISLDEAKYIFEERAERLIIGTGQTGMVKLSDEAADYFRKNKCQVQLLPTPDAIRIWNKSDGEIIALFHVTC